MKRIAVVAGVTVVLAALLIALFVAARQRAKLHHCRNNLRMLGRLAEQNAPLIRQLVEQEEYKRVERGRRFWQQIREVRYKTVRGDWMKIDPDPFVCPVHGRTVSKPEDFNAIDYRGPNYDPEKPSPDLPLAADRPGNHPSGGYVLFPDQSVEEVPFRVDDWGGNGGPAETIDRHLSD